MSAGASEAHSEAVAVRDDLVYVPVVVREGGHNLLQPLDVGLEVLLGGRSHRGHEFSEVVKAVLVAGVDVARVEGCGILLAHTWQPRTPHLCHQPDALNCREGRGHPTVPMGARSQTGGLLPVQLITRGTDARGGHVRVLRSPRRAL